MAYWQNNLKCIERCSIHTYIKYVRRYLNDMLRKKTVIGLIIEDNITINPSSEG